MPKLIDADKVAEAIDWLNEYDFVIWHDVMECIDKVPAVDVEPTEEQIKEYCRKRCLVIIDSELFNEMKAQWSANRVRHGHWVNHISENGATDGTFCSICDYEIDRDARYNYCPNCGARMDREKDRK